jgi:hypothetical protein
MVADDLIRKISPRGLCLNLVRELIAEELLIAECTRYLDVVEAKARAQSDEEVAGTASRLKSRL